MSEYEYKHWCGNCQINHKAAIDALGEKPLAWTEGEYELGLQNQWQSDVDALNDLPSAQPEIIRCKDCKYITEHYDTDGNAPYWTCSEWNSGTDYDGFCHYAERRTDETD